MSMEAALVVEDLRVGLHTDVGVREIVRGLNFQLARGQVLALVGESGAGKTLASHGVIRIPPAPQVRFLGGKIELDGDDLASLSEEELATIRGRRLVMLFQDPTKSLDPRHPILAQLRAVLRHYEKVSKQQALERAVALLERLGLKAERFVGRYPHELSGGMRQLAYIAMSLATPASVLILDEPTTALDALTRRKVMEVLREESSRLGRSMLLVTHDLALTELLADELLIMLAGVGLERLPVSELHQAAHPYTRQLIQCTPELGRDSTPSVEGLPDSGALAWDEGCPYRNRCRRAREACNLLPPPVHLEERHWVACHFPLDEPL